jgi:transposase
VPAPHPVEFRQLAVELARTGDEPVAALAKDLGISESCLRTWMAQASADDGGRPDRLTCAEKEELAELRRLSSWARPGSACTCPTPNAAPYRQGRPRGCGRPFVPRIRCAPGPGLAMELAEVLIGLNPRVRGRCRCRR